MDSIAGANGKVSEESERQDGSDFVEVGIKGVENEDSGSSKDEHQFQKAIGAWRSKTLPVAAYTRSSC